MPRVNHVKNARKDQGSCGKCGKPLNVGDPYRWWKFRYGGKHKRCMAPECSPKAADLTQSPFLSTLYTAQEVLNDAGSEAVPEDAAAMLRDGAEQLREAAEIRTEAADNMEDGFGHETEPSSMLREEGESVEYWADEIEGIADTLENHEDEDVEGDLEEWVAEQCEAANSGCPV